jgi:hypothetical protein
MRMRSRWLGLGQCVAIWEDRLAIFLPFTNVSKSILYPFGDGLVLEMAVNR